MSKRYPQVFDGDRVAPVMKGYRMACCDCGLVHKVDFEVVVRGPVKADGTWSSKTPRNHKNLQVILIPSRDNRATAQKRRRRKGVNP